MEMKKIGCFVDKHRLRNRIKEEGVDKGASFRTVAGNVLAAANGNLLENLQQEICCCSLASF